MSKKNFSQKKTLKNDFENRSEVLTMSDGWDPPVEATKINFVNFVNSISVALSKVLKPYFSNSPLDRTFHQKTRLLSAPPAFSAKGQRLSR